MDATVATQRVRSWQRNGISLRTIARLTGVGRSTIGLLAAGPRGDSSLYNSETAEHGQAAIAWLDYLSTPDFWNRTLQNWQSEFLAVGTMIAFSIFLRQRGSSESKPVGAPHHQSAIDAE